MFWCEHSYVENSTLRRKSAVLRRIKISSCSRLCTDTIAALSIIYFFLDFVSGDLALTGFQL